MANNDFIINLHKDFNFPLDTLRDYLYENINIVVSDFIKITNGCENEVYDIGQYMVKIRRKGEVPYSCIKWAVI